MKLADNEEAAGEVANAIARNFEKLPENLSNILFGLADNSNRAKYVSYTIAANFYHLLSKVRTELLRRTLSK
jgi:hypothetical protein